MQDDYANLVRSAATGDPEALDRLLLRAQEVAWRFSTSVCGHADDAEDAMQEALIKTYRYVGRIREPEAFRPWLYRTVRNACLMGRRKRAGEPARLQSLDEVTPAADGRDTPGRAASREESGTAGGQRRAASSAARGAEHLPGPYRAIVFLREMEGLSTREVAKVMGMTEDNVKTRLHRARVQLQAHLGRARNEDPNPPIRALPHTVAGAVAVSGRRHDARPSAGNRTTHRSVRVLWEGGRRLAEDDSCLPRRRKETAAPRRAITRGGADQGISAREPASPEAEANYPIGRRRSPFWAYRPMR